MLGWFALKENRPSENTEVLIATPIDKDAEDPKDRYCVYVANYFLKDTEVYEELAEKFAQVDLEKIKGRPLTVREKLEFAIFNNAKRVIEEDGFYYLDYSGLYGTYRKLNEDYISHWAVFNYPSE